MNIFIIALLPLFLLFNACATKNFSLQNALSDNLSIEHLHVSNMSLEEINFRGEFSTPLPPQVMALLFKDAKATLNLKDEERTKIAAIKLAEGEGKAFTFSLPLESFIPLFKAAKGSDASEHLDLILSISSPYLPSSLGPSISKDISIPIFNPSISLINVEVIKQKLHINFKVSNPAAFNMSSLDYYLIIGGETFKGQAYLKNRGITKENILTLISIDLIDILKIPKIITADNMELLIKGNIIINTFNVPFDIKKNFTL